MHMCPHLSGRKRLVSILAIMETASNTHEQTWGTQLVTYKTHDTLIIAMYSLRYHT